jgi:hypothetical protein
MVLQVRPYPLCIWRSVRVEPSIIARAYNLALAQLTVLDTLLCEAQVQGHSVRITEGSATSFFIAPLELLCPTNIAPLVLRSLDFAGFYFAPLRADDDGAAGNCFPLA